MDLLCQLDYHPLLPYTLGSRGRTRNPLVRIDCRNGHAGILYRLWLHDQHLLRDGLLQGYGRQHNDNSHHHPELHVVRHGIRVRYVLLDTIGASPLTLLLRITPWLDGLGYQNCFISAAFVSLVITSGFLVMIKFGKRLRARSRIEYWALVNNDLAAGMSH